MDPRHRQEVRLARRGVVRCGVRKRCDGRLLVRAASTCIPRHSPCRYHASSDEFEVQDEDDDTKLIRLTQVRIAEGLEGGRRGFAFIGCASLVVLLAHRIRAYSSSQDRVIRLDDSLDGLQKGDSVLAVRFSVACIHWDWGMCV